MPIPNNVLWGFFYSLPVFLSMIIALVRFKKVVPEYHPFLYAIILSALTELARMIEIYLFYTYDTHVGYYIYNIYVLLYPPLCLWFMFNKGLFEGNKKWLYGTIIFWVLVWLTDHFVINGINIDNQTKLYRIVYSAMVCLFTIQLFNRLIVNERKLLIKNATFIICCGWLLFFVPYLLMQSISYKQSLYTMDFLKKISASWSILLPFIYFIYSSAILCMPSKKTFIQI